MVMGQVRINKLIDQVVSDLETLKELEELVNSLPEPYERGVESRQLFDMKSNVHEMRIHVGQTLSYANELRSLMTQYEVGRFGRAGYCDPAFVAGINNATVAAEAAVPGVRYTEADVDVKVETFDGDVKVEGSTGVVKTEPSSGKVEGDIITLED